MKNGLISLAENVIQTTEVLRYSNGTFYDTEVSYISVILSCGEIHLYDCYNHLFMSYTAVHIYTFLKGCKGAKTKEVNETVYFGDTEESSDSDQERTKGKAFIYKPPMYLVRVYLSRRILVLYAMPSLYNFCYYYFYLYNYFEL